MINTALSHFNVTAKLGEGGMGEVYRAEDTKLGREVAIKVLPEAVAQDPERLARFEREAKVLAALNHPYISAIYSLESAETAGGVGEPLAGPREGASPSPTDAATSRTVHFLVMELAEGEDLAERLTRGPMSADEVLPMALQMAEALEAAHERGIIHRDLKPANVKVDEEGKVKVLDFGLAKALDSTDGEDSGSLSGQRISASLSPTLTAQMTGAGVILGTAAYMSPEQAKGKTVDKRSDIWAFGLVCFEMLTGKKLFAAESVAETLAGVIKTDVDFDDLPKDLPIAFRRLLRRCLERDPRNRLHDIADGRIVIDEILSGTVEETVAIPESSTGSSVGWRKYLPYLVGAVGLAAGLWALATNRPGEIRTRSVAKAVQFEVQAPTLMRLASGLAISPDEQHIVMVVRGEDGRTRLWLRRFDSVEARPLGGTLNGRYPFWSPDSLRVGFFANGQLMVTDLISDSPQGIAATESHLNVRGGTWGADDTIVYAPNYIGPLMHVSASGGEPQLATRLPDDGSIGTHRFPEFLPDGRHFLFYASGGTGTEPGELYLAKVGSPDAELVGPSNSRGTFAHPDHLLYVRGEALLAHRFDTESLQLTGEPTSLGVTLPGSLAVSGYRSLSIGPSGILAYRLETRGANSLQIVDRAGELIETLPTDREAWQIAPRLSPDGKRLIIGRYESGVGRGDLWIHDLERGIADRLTGDIGDESYPSWSPDQQWIVFDSIRSSPRYGLYLAPVDRLEDELLLLEREVGGFPVSFWLPDGKSIVYEGTKDNGDWGFWVLKTDGSGEREPFLPDATSKWAAVLSPDDRWVAYSSNASGREEVYLRAFDGTGSAIRISTSGGGQANWRSDGSELFYVNATNELVAVPVTAGDPPSFGKPEVLFQTRLEESTDRQYEVLPDGQRFILNEPLMTSDEPIIVTSNWQNLLEKSR